MTTTTELLRARFRELNAEKAALEGRFASQFSERDKLLSDIEALNGQAKAMSEIINRDFKPEATRIATEISTIIRVLNGKTGEV